jgi:hypothetical protein
VTAPDVSWPGLQDEDEGFLRGSMAGWTIGCPMLAPYPHLAYHGTSGRAPGDLQYAVQSSSRLTSIDYLLHHIWRRPPNTSSSARYGLIVAESRVVWNRVDTLELHDGPMGGVLQDCTVLCCAVRTSTY